jgi:hypothetical protein
MTGFRFRHVSCPWGCGSGAFHARVPVGLKCEQRFTPRIFGGCRLKKRGGEAVFPSRFEAEQASLARLYPYETHELSRVAIARRKFNPHSWQTLIGVTPTASTFPKTEFASTRPVPDASSSLI